jgi:hypothetical protein
MQRLTAAICICLFSFSGVASANDKTPQAWNSKSISWESTNPNGVKSAVLQGRDGEVGDPYTYAVFIPAGSHKLQRADSHRCEKSGTSIYIRH